MKKLILLGASVFLVFACNELNSNAEKIITQGDDSVASMEIPTYKIDALNALAEMNEEMQSSKLLFKASGIEPGWFAEFYTNKLRLLLDYGKDSLIMIDQKFEGLDDKEGFIFGIQGDKEISKNVDINIINKPCVDAGSENVRDRTVIIKYKGKTYKGCGSFVK